MIKPEMPPDPSDPPPRGLDDDAEASIEYRHRFARRWARKRAARTTRHAWRFLLLDLTLLVVVVVLTWLLTRALM
jgi:hypothetical protein